VRSRERNGRKSTVTNPNQLEATKSAKFECAFATDGKERLQSPEAKEEEEEESEVTSKEYEPERRLRR
jgi:hypothetical protein